MARINRRRFLKASGAAAVGAKMGIAGILASHQAPVFAQANTVHILRWNDFVPAADKVLREVYVPEVQKALGLKLNVETINANDIPARATSAIQSGNGPDIIMLLNNYPHLYASAAVDVSALAEEVGKAQGGIYAPAAQLNRVGGKWVSMPWSLVPALIAYRKSWFDEVGAKELPEDLAAVPRGRQEAQGGEAPDRPDARQHLRRCADLHLSAAVVLRRPGSRRQGQGGARLEGDARVGALHGAVLEGRARRRRPRLGRLATTTARSSPATSAPR